MHISSVTLAVTKYCNVGYYFLKDCLVFRVLKDERLNESSENVRGQMGKRADGFLIH